MFTFAKAQIASFIASVVDYFITIICTEWFGFWYVVASGIGTVIGGLTNFSLGRRWVFTGGEKQRYVQLFRYFLVWLGYLVLATSGVYLVTHHGGLNYILSKVIVSLFLAVVYNYPLQKRFVFR